MSAWCIVDAEWLGRTKHGRDDYVDIVHGSPKPPAGLYLTGGDGVALLVTAEMLARADDPENWEIMTPELRREMTRKAQKRLDLFLAPLLEPSND